MLMLRGAWSWAYKKYAAFLLMDRDRIVHVMNAIIPQTERQTQPYIEQYRRPIPSQYFNDSV